MAMSLQDKISTIKNRYHVRLPADVSESTLDDILRGKYHKLEVINVASGRKANKFSAHNLKRASTADIRKMIYKHKNKHVPSSLHRDLLTKILTGKLNVDTLTDDELKQLGKGTRSTGTQSLDMYAGWIPKVKKYLDKKDIKRGKKQARKL